MPVICETPHEAGKRMVKESGYHKDEAQDEGLVKNMVKKSALKRKQGGSVDGKEPEARPDKRARGGAMGKGPKIGAVNVNVHHSDPAAEQMAKQQGVQQGLQAGVKMGAQRALAAARPPMAPPPSAPMAAPPGAGAGAAPMAGPGPAMPPRPAPAMAANGGALGRKSGGKVEC